jgi:hypothetical protein
MVKKVVLDCPCCQKRCDIFLSTNASILLINCPFCSSPLLYYKRESFELTARQLDDIQNHCQETSIVSMLRKIAHHALASSQAQAAAAAPRKTRRRSVRVKSHKTLITCGVAKQRNPEGIYISRDDITNLRITLETCRDVQEFINSL